MTKMLWQSCCDNRRAAAVLLMTTRSGPRGVPWRSERWVLLPQLRAPKDTGSRKTAPLKAEAGGDACSGSGCCRTDPSRSDPLQPRSVHGLQGDSAKRPRPGSSGRVRRSPAQRGQSGAGGSTGPAGSSPSRWGWAHGPGRGCDCPRLLPANLETWDAKQGRSVGELTHGVRWESVSPFTLLEQGQQNSPFSSQPCDAELSRSFTATRSIWGSFSSYLFKTKANTYTENTSCYLLASARRWCFRCFQRQPFTDNE